MSAQLGSASDRIDILLATYNGERFLAEQLDSIAAQTHTNWQLIVRDDGSSDGTPALIEAFRARHPDKVTVLADADGNLGLVQNFSRLMQHSDAPYAAFCDQDDVWMAEKLELSLAKMQQMEREQGADGPLLVFNDLMVVDDTLQPIHRSFWRYQRVQPGWCNHLSRLLTQNMVTGCTMLMNRSLVALASPIPPALAYHDWWTALVSAAFGTSGYCAEPTVRYRQHMQNVVGARADRSALWRTVSLLRTWTPYKATARRRFVQAELFRQHFGSQLKSADRDTLDGFIAFRKGNALQRIRLACKHKFLPLGLIRSFYFVLVSPG